MTKSTSNNLFKHLRISDARGLAQLTTQAIAGVTRIAEGVHQSVADTVWDAVLNKAGMPGGAVATLTHGITGLAYKGVHDTTLLVGKGMDLALAGLHPFIEDRPNTPQRQAMIAALNGVMGDRLAADQNPLATPMALRYRDEALDLHVQSPIPEATGKVLLLVHGLCMNDLQWRAPQNDSEANGDIVDHGAALAAALGYTPVYLRYNSGLHTSQNGRALSVQLEQLIAHWPVPVEELTVMAHSMGGLLTRSAFHYATQENLRWPDHLQNIVFLGTPHHGAPLERIGNWVDVILGSTPYTAPFAALGQLRSAGITDLRYGHVLDEDWQGKNRFHRSPDRRHPLPLPEDVTCYAVAATTASQRSALANHLIGDGLVPLHSALGLHAEAPFNLDFPPDAQWIGYRMSHMALLSSPDVTRQMVRWLTPT